MTSPPPFSRLAAAVVAAAALGVAVELLSADIRDWFNHHSFTGNVLAGSLMIAATYLIVERALADRERRRWAEIAQPLLQEIAAVVAGSDAEIRAGTATPDRCQKVLNYLFLFQPVLTTTAELTTRWHDALSVAQHAATVAAHGGEPDAGYETAWAEFQRSFDAIHDFHAAPQNMSETYKGPAVTAEQPKCPRCGAPYTPDADFCSCGEYLRWDTTSLEPTAPDR